MVRDKYPLTCFPDSFLINESPIDLEGVGTPLTPLVHAPVHDRPHARKKTQGGSDGSVEHGPNGDLPPVVCCTKVVHGPVSTSDRIAAYMYRIQLRIASEQHYAILLSAAGTAYTDLNKAVWSSLRNRIC